MSQDHSLWADAVTIAEITQLRADLAEREGLVCGDCDGSGWLDNAVEGRYPCTCMTEAEPYQLLQQQLAECKKDAEKYQALKSIIDRFPEINPRNYDHEAACFLNAWGVELVLADAAISQKEEAKGESVSKELLSRLQRHYVMSMFASADDLYAAMNKERGEAAEALKSQAREIEVLKIAHHAHEDSNLKMLAKLKQQSFVEKELRAALVEAEKTLYFIRDGATGLYDKELDKCNKALTRCKDVLNG
jgi:hypothetical protein